MIQHKTARALLYAWHSGQASTLYAVASSGLVHDFDSLIYSIKTIPDEVDRNKLLEWALMRQKKVKTKVMIGAVLYFPMPWAFRPGTY